MRRRISLAIQQSLGRLNFIWMGPLVLLIAKVVLRYRFPDARKTREQFRAILQEIGKAPLIICPNHLTKVDSILLLFHLFSWRQLLFSYRSLPWNVPELKRVNANPIYVFLCYLGKCICIERGGRKLKTNAALEKVTYLLKNRETLCIFPEGTRSRTGKVDPQQIAYGVGRIISNLNDAHVLCIYLRGDGQHSYSAYPRHGERFHCELNLIKPASSAIGLRAAREISRTIVDTLSTMEECYFAHR